MRKQWLRAGALAVCLAFSVPAAAYAQELSLIHIFSGPPGQMSAGDPGFGQDPAQDLL